ncbi:hypothetical protein T03_1610 [Trichinella britovi]|uniref:Uncharacterized protein n=1 Tax=Trichinella britovi TaxID=45882 RepID=A0A0V1D621_TRIBR|nr:hypothetical protein T03_1610 [Trichinella britovi]
MFDKGIPKNCVVLYNTSLFLATRIFFIFRPFGINFEKLFRDNLNCAQNRLLIIFLRDCDCQYLTIPESLSYDIENA